MGKKYQVFISSTYSDLIEERAAVSQCLLEMGCIPVGMEQFPASNMSQMEYIKMMLDDCDYYVLILGGKYGTLDSDGIGFTEKEYDYAIKKGIPIMSFVIKDIGKLAVEKCEETDDGRRRTEAFREKVCRGKLVKFYENCENLQTVVAISLYCCIHDFPAPGWVRGDNVETPSYIDKKIEEYIAKYMETHTMSKEDVEALLAEDITEEDENSSIEKSCDTISLAGARAMIEELAKRMPKNIEWHEF